MQFVDQKNTVLTPVLSSEAHYAQAESTANLSVHLLRSGSGGPTMQPPKTIFF